MEKICGAAIGQAMRDQAVGLVEQPLPLLIKLQLLHLIRAEAEAGTVSR